MKYDPEEAPEGYCESCGLPCVGALHDEGTGPFEFWGQKGVDHQYVFLSDCCEAEVLEHNPCCSECGKHEIEDFGLCLECLGKED